MRWFKLEALLLLFLVYLSISSGAVVLRVTGHVVASNPRFTLKAGASSLVASIVGYILNGYVPIEIILFGITGFLVYVLYLLITGN